MNESKKLSLKNLGKKEKAIVAGLAALACCIPLGAVVLNSQPDTPNENSEKNTSKIVLGTKTKDSVKVHFSNESEKAIKSIRLKKSNEKSWSDNLLKSSEKIGKSADFDLYAELYKKSFDIELKFMDGSVSVFEKVGTSVKGSISIATRNDKMFLQYVEKGSNEWIELSDSKKVSSDKDEKSSDKDKKDSDKKDSDKKDSKDEKGSKSKADKKTDSENKSGSNKDTDKDTNKNGSTSESTSKPNSSSKPSTSSKPSKNESSSENKPSSDKKPTGSTGSSSSKNDKPCTPKYEYVTIPAVTHEEPIVIKEAWEEHVPTKFRCQCGLLFDSMEECNNHQQEKTDNGDYNHGSSSTVSGYVIKHDAVMGSKTVTDIPERKEKRQVGCE